MLLCHYSHLVLTCEGKPGVGIENGNSMWFALLEVGLFYGSNWLILQPFYGSDLLVITDYVASKADWQSFKQCQIIFS